MTLWDFRGLVGKLNPSYSLESVRDEEGKIFLQQNVFPSVISLYRYTGVSLLKETDNGRTLGELKFKVNEQLNAF